MVNILKLRELQLDLAKKVSLRDTEEKIEKIAGADIAYKDNKAFVACVVLDYKTLNLLEVKTSTSDVTFPYTLGFLAFREAEPIIKTFKKLENSSDVLMLDGHGVAHPLKIGLASHVGVLLNIRTIGVAKNLLCGEIRDNKIIVNNEILGHQLKTNGKRIFISSGNKVSLQKSLEITLKTIRNHRLPEPLRIAHEKANESKNKL